MTQTRDDYMTAQWWNSVIKDAMLIIEPIMQEQAEKLAGGGYAIGQEPPTWESLMAILDKNGPEYTGEMLRRMLVNPTTSADAAKLFQTAMQKAAERRLAAQPEALRYAAELGGVP